MGGCGIQGIELQAAYLNWIANDGVDIIVKCHTKRPVTHVAVMTDANTGKFKMVPILAPPPHTASTASLFHTC